MLAVLALPEDGQQLPPPDNVLDLQQTFPSEVRSDERASGPLPGHPENRSQDTELEPWARILPACVARATTVPPTAWTVKMKVHKEQICNV